MLSLRVQLRNLFGWGAEGRVDGCGPEGGGFCPRGLSGLHGIVRESLSLIYKLQGF